MTVAYRPITELKPFKLPDGSVQYREASISGLGALGMKDPNRGKKVGTAVATVGGVVAEINPVIGGIIVAAGALITAFSNSKKTQKTNAEAGKYEEANQELQSQNQQLDQKIQELQSAIVDAKKKFGLDPNVSLTGLGWCLVNCAKNDASLRLKSAKTLYDQLTQAQDERIDIIQKLAAEADRLFRKNTTVNIAYVGAGLIALGALIYYLKS